MTRTLLTSGYGGKIYSLVLDPKNTPAAAQLVIASTTDGGPASTWFSLSERHAILYAGCEFAEPDGEVRSFRYDRTTGRLSPLNTGKCGQGPVHIALSSDGRRLFTANYADGSLSELALKEDGTIDESVEAKTKRYTGSGPSKERQEAPHVHGVYVDPTGEYLLAADLGSDVLRIVKIASGAFEDLPAITLPPGNGPRHLLILPPSEHSSRTLVYLIEELSSTIAVFELEYPSDKQAALNLKEIQREVSTLPPDWKDSPGEWTAAEIVLSPNGRYLYATNRSPVDNLAAFDTLTIFELRADGGLNTVNSPRYVNLGGLGPRHFALSPETADEPAGKYLAVALERSNEVVILEVDQEKQDEMKEVARLKDVDQPTCIQWLP